MTDRRLPGLRSAGLRGFLALFFFLAAAPSAFAQALTTNFGSELGTFSTGELQYQLIASGGTGTYTWDITAGSLPPGVALRTDKPSWFAPNASAGLIGVPTLTGRYNFTLRVQSGAQSLSVATGITITTLNVNAPFDLPDALTAPGYSYTLTPLNNVGGVTWAIANGSLPPGLGLNGTTGVIAGTPTTPGLYNFTYSLTEGTTTIFRGANIRVSRVKILSTVLPNATLFEPYGPVSVDATGGTGSYTFAQSGDIPVGLSMNSAGVITGTPTGGQGRYAFNVTVTDSANNTYSKNVAIFVDTASRHVPVLRPYSGYFDDCTLGTYCRVGADLSFGGTAPFTISATGLPNAISAIAGGTNAATFVAPGDIEVSGVATTTGSFAPHLQVTDANGGISANIFPLRVSTLALRTDGINGIVGTPYSVTLRIIGGAGPYHAALARGPLPAGLSFDATTLTISGTPAESGFFGPLFDITDNNGEPLKAGYYFSIEDQVPGVQINNFGDLGTISSGSFYSNQLSACCIPVTWSVIGGALPPGFNLSTGGLLSGSTTSTGIYKFLVKATDNGNSSRFDVRQFQLAISFVTIQTSSSLPNGFVGSPYSQDLVAQYGPGTLTWSVDPFTALPAGLSLVQAGLNQWKLSGTPTVAGQFNFHLFAVDGAGIPNSRYFQLFIFPAGATPTLNVTTGSNFGTWTLGEVEAQLFATGGTGVYTWQLVGGTLPTGVAVRQSPDLAPWFSPSASAGLIGVATVPGPYSFALRVTSGSQTVDVPFTMTISSLAPDDPFSIPNAFVGEDYSFTLLASGASGPVTWTPNGALPPGLTLSSAGVISGKPTTAGFYNISYALTDGTGNVFRTVSLSIFGLHISSSGALDNARQNVPYLAHIDVAGGTAPYHFDIGGSLPSGLALDPATGDISGTPTTTGLGRFTFTVTVTDANRVSYSKTMAIVLIPGQPSVTSILPYGTDWDDCAFGVYCARGIGAFTGGKAPFTWTITGLPAGLAFRYGDATAFTPGDVEIYGVPREVGTFIVHVTMTDADRISNTNEFPLRISRLYMPEGISSGTINQPYFSHMRTIGGTQPYTATAIGGILPAGLSFDGSTLDLKGTPLENGSFSIVVQVTDAVGNKYKISRGLFISAGTSTVSISSADLGIGLVGQNFSATLFACCLPNPFTWSLESGTPPAGLTLSSSGTITGIIAAANAVGPYKFLVRAADLNNPVNAAIKQITITVSNLQITSGNPPTGNVGTPYNFAFTASGGSGTRTWSLVPFLPLGLTLDPSTGVISGTPLAASLVNLVVRVSDTAGNLATRSVSLAIYPTGIYPPLTLSFSSSLTASIGTFTNGIFTTSITGGLPPYQLSLTPGSDVVPGMRLITDPALTKFFGTTVIADYAGVLTTPGVYHPSIRVTDANGTIIDKPFTLTVVPFSVLSPSTITKATRNVPYSYQLVAYNPTGANLSWTGVSMPAGLTVDPATGLVSGTPTTAGPTTVRVQVTDLNTSASSVFSFNITIDPYAITTSALLPAGAVNVPYSTTFSAPDCGSPCNWTGSPGLNLSMSSAGVLSGTPTGSFGGTFTVTASGPNGTVSKIFSLFINPGATPALSITTIGIGDVSTGGLVTLGANATGGAPPYNWSLDSGNLPKGVWLATSGADYSANLGSGFPFLLGRAMEPGTFNFTIRVTDQNGASATRSYTWNVSRLAYFSTFLPVTGTTLVYNQPYTQALLALGGSGTYPGWTNLTATPTGLTLNATSGVVSGTPGNTGNVTTQVRVSDSDNNTLTGNWTFNIAGPTATLLNFPINALTLTPGIQFSTNITPTGGTAPYTVTALSALPPGLALAGDLTVGGPLIPGQIFLIGIPLAPGVYPVTLQAQDSSPTPNVGVRTITVTVVSAIATTISLPDGSVGHAYSQPLVAFDTTGPVTWSVAITSGMPPGMSLDPAGAVVGTPTTAGTFSFVLNFSNAAGFVAARTYTLNVSPIFSDSPSILPTGTAGVPYNYTLTGSGGAGTLLWSAPLMPPGLSLSPLGVISGTPTSVGVFTITATATDGVRPISRQFTIPIKASIPSLLDIGLTATRLNDLVAGVYGVLTLNAANGVPPYSWRLASGSSLPQGLRLVTGTDAGTSFLPTATIIAGIPSAPGAYTFDLIATDAAGSEVRRTYTLNITRIALLTAAIPNVIAGNAVNTRFVAVGGTGPYTFTISPVNATQEMLPPGLDVSAAGILAGTTTSTGFYSFFLKAQDSAGNSITRTFSVNVVTASLLQIVTSNPPNLWVGGGLRGEIDLRTNGSSTYTWAKTAGTLPPGMNLVTGIGGPNSTELVGAPTTPGDYTFTLTATDTAPNTSNVASHVFKIHVAPMQIVTPPLALIADLASDLPAGQAGVAYSFTLKSAGGKPPYTYSQSPFIPLPAGLTLSSSGVIAGTTALTGRFIIAPIVTDADGRTLNSPPMGLVIAPAGARVPLVLGNFDGELPGASAGAPFAFPIDRLIRTGAGPFAWTLAPAVPPAVNALPPGMTIVSGANGTDSYLAGTPTTPGDYTFSLLVTDSSAPQQSLTVPFSVTVSPIALTPDSLPPGKVGSPYSQPMVASGGTGPYSVALYPPSDMPAGMSLSNGLLAGTPASTGNYLIAVIVTDAAGHQLFKIYRLAIDNALGEAPALALAPKPIQIYYEIGAQAPPPLPIVVTTTSGAQPFSLSLTGVPSASLSATNGTTNTAVTLNLNVASVSEGIYRGLLAASAPGAANIIDELPISLTIAKAPGCTFAVNPTVRGTPSAGEPVAKTFSVLTGAACKWTATASDPWITITAGASGTGTASVAYTVAPNPGSSERTGTISVNGVPFTITQFGTACTYTLNPASVNATAAGGTMFVGVLTPIGCALAAPTSTDVAFTAPPAGKVGVNVVVAPNAGPTRILNATIAGQPFLVYQSGIECTATLNPYSTSIPAAGTTGSVNITLPAACSYNTVLGPNWINVTSGASGAGPSGSVVYSIAPNPTTESRTGALTIGGQSFVITQEALACSVTVDTTALGAPYGPNGATGALGITANGVNCAWTASSNVPWATLAPSSGTGSATVGVTITSNAASDTGRTGSFTVAGQTINISQAGTTCTFELGSDTGSAPASGGSGSVRVTAPSVCAWSSASNAPWLSITASGSGGTADVRFAAQSNTSATPRVGTLTVANTTYTVNQAGAACTFNITGSATSPTFASDGATGQVFGFTSTISGCTAPAPVSYANWITVDASSFAGTAGSATYSVAPNPFGTSRKGTIQVGSATFNVVQSGSACAYSLNEYGHVFHSSGGDATVLGSPTAPACTPVTGTNQPSFITLSPLAGPDLNIFSLPYNVAPFTPLTPLIRYGNVTFGGQIVVIKQYSW